MHNKIQIEVLVESSKNCSRSRIVASPYYRMKILVAAASDRANMVFIITTTLQPHCLFIHKVATTSLQCLSQACYNLVTTLSQPWKIFTTPLQACDNITIL